MIVGEKGETLTLVCQHRWKIVFQEDNSDNNSQYLSRKNRNLH